MTERQKEYRKRYEQSLREKKLAEGKMKNIESRVTVKHFGLRVVVSTFNKYDTKTINLDGTVNCDGLNYDADALKAVESDLTDCITMWIKGGQQDFDTKYIALVDVKDKKNMQTAYKNIYYRPKNKHINFDITLKLKKQLPWKEVVKVATEHIHCLYYDIAKVIECNGLKLKDFKGNNLKNK